MDFDFADERLAGSDCPLAAALLRKLRERTKAGQATTIIIDPVPGRVLVRFVPQVERIAAECPQLKELMFSRRKGEMMVKWERKTLHGADASDWAVEYTEPS